MSGFVNNTTTLMGMALIPYASYLLLKLEKFGSMDFCVVCIVGLFLIWFKDSSAKEVIEKILNYKFSRIEDKDINSAS